MKSARLEFLAVIFAAATAIGAPVRAQTASQDTTLIHRLAEAQQHGWRIRITTDTGVTAAARVNDIQAGEVRLVGGASVDESGIRRVERRRLSGGGGKSMAIGAALLVGGLVGVTYANICDCTNYKTAGFKAGLLTGAIAGGLGWLVGNALHPPVEHWSLVWAPQ